jgi:hypothetical protein
MYFISGVPLIPISPHRGKKEAASSINKAIAMPQTEIRRYCIYNGWNNKPAT